MKKNIWIVFIGTLILIISFIGYLVYQQYRKQIISTPSSQETAPSFPASTSSSSISSVSLSTPSPQVALLVSDIPLFDYWLDTAGNLYIITPEGHILFKEGEEYVVLTEQKLSDIHIINPSSDGKNVLIVYNFPYNPIYAVFHTETATWTSLPVKVEAADWNPRQSDDIIYLKEGSLFIFNISTGKSKVVMKLNVLDVDLEWRTPDTVLITEKPSATLLGTSWIIQLSTQKINKLYQEKGLIIRSNDVLELRSFINSEKQPRFVFADVHSGFEIIKSGTLFTTLQSHRALPYKCVLDNLVVYCAVPQFTPSKIEYPDDYLNRSFYTHDIIYKAEVAPSLNLVGSREIYISDEPLDAYHLSVSNTFLYFINRIDQKLYRISLQSKST